MDLSFAVFAALMLGTLSIALLATYAGALLAKRTPSAVYANVLDERKRLGTKIARYDR